MENWLISKLKANQEDILKKIEEYEKKVYESVGENKQLDNALIIVKAIFKDIKQLLK